MHFDVEVALLPRSSLIQRLVRVLAAKECALHHDLRHVFAFFNRARWQFSFDETFRIVHSDELAD